MYGFKLEKWAQGLRLGKLAEQDRMETGSDSQPGGGWIPTCESFRALIMFYPLGYLRLLWSLSMGFPLPTCPHQWRIGQEEGQRIE